MSVVKSEQQEEINNKNMGEEGKPTGGCEEPTQQVSGKRQFPFFCIEISPVSREFEVTAFSSQSTFLKSFQQVWALTSYIY